MSIEWPSELVDAIARRYCVVFLGAGVSRQSTNDRGDRPKTWREFLDTALARTEGQTQSFRRAVRGLVNEKDYLLACQMIKDALGNQAFHNLVRDEYLNPGFQPAPIHDSIINLDVRVVATPNFDKIFEGRINVVQNNSVIVKNYYDGDLAESLRGTTRIVVKIHGSIDQPPRMIFTRQEYASARQKYREFYDILGALCVTHTFLFIGCGLNDPDIQLLLEDYGFKFDYACPHYFALPKNCVRPEALPAIERSLNIKILTYDPRDEHQLLKESVDGLCEKVYVRRAEIQATAQW